VQTGQIGVVTGPVDGLHDALSQQFNVEHLAAVLRFLFGQEIEQQGGQVVLVQELGHPAIARAEPAAAASVHKHHQTQRVGRDHQIPGQRESAKLNGFRCEQGGHDVDLAPDKSGRNGGVGTQLGHAGCCPRSML